MYDGKEQPKGYSSYCDNERLELLIGDEEVTVVYMCDYLE